MAKAMFTSKDIRAELARMGIKKGVIKIILWLRSLIIFFDSRVFSKPIPIRLCRKTSKSYPDDMAGYSQKTKKHEEHYIIFISNVNGFMRHECRLKNIANLLVGKSSYEDCPYSSKDEVLIRIAAHEVRHRLQYHSTKKFYRSHIHSVKHPFLREAIRWVGLLFKEDAKIYREKGKSQKFICHRINPLEFDARVIECCIAAAVHGKEILGKDIHLLRNRRFVKKLLLILQAKPPV